MLSTIGFVVVADLVGVAGAFYCDTFLSSRSVSTALFFAIWFVDGVFCGMLHYMTCLAIVTPDGKNPLDEAGVDRRTGLLAILTTVVILSLSAFFFYKHDWQYPRADSVFVPDSEALTLTFFITIVVMMIFIHHVTAPEKYKLPVRKKKK